MPLRLQATLPPRTIAAAGLLLGILLSAAVLLGAAPAAAQQMPAQPKVRTLTFLHVNDVYEIWPKRGIGGLAELGALVKKEREAAPNAVMTLGGDLISPSLMSSLTKGKHMIRFIMWMTKGPTDLNGTFEFTDWDDVDAFARRVADRLAPPGAGPD